MPTIKVPDLGKASVIDDEFAGSLGRFPLLEYEVTSKQAANWNKLNEKEQLTLVLKADRERKDIRDYL